METKENGPSAKAAGFKRFINVIIAALNVALVLGAFLMYIRYSSVYQQRLREENLGNIANLNASASANAMSLISSWNIKLEDIAQYVQLHDMTLEQTLTFISETNSSADRYFELIGSDYTGYLAKLGEDGAFLPLDYTSGSYAAMRGVFDDVNDEAYSDIRFAPEFTDGGETALKFFAIYKHLTLKNASGAPESYALLLAARSKDVLSVLNSYDDYEGQSTVMIDGDGNYIVGSKDFKSNNFFQYLYVYNDLTLDQKNAIKRQLEENGSGELYYKNAGAVVQDCVFRYERMEANGWYCVTCVPLEAFRTPVFSINYIIYAVAMLIALFAVDIAWLQNMNRRLRASMLREKEASAAKGNFMSRMSHEIRTPLNAVIGYNVIARRELTEPGERRQIEMKVMDCLTKSDIASKHLLSIINDVLDMSAIESGKIQVAHDRFDFRALITSLTTIFYSQAKAKGVDFQVALDKPVEEWFMGDQMRVNQILTNLLSNAVKFTPEGGAVKLAITPLDEAEGLLNLRFDVTDTGIGMTDEYIGHIWTPFEQADSSISRRFGGTGLGLAITKNLVDLMGGSINVESALGEGTKFTVQLAFERADTPRRAQNLSYSHIDALIIDGDDTSRNYLKQLFQKCGARCAAAATFDAALRAIKVHPSRYSVCVADCQSPVNGAETIRRIKLAAPGCAPRAFALAAYDYTELAERAPEAGSFEFLPKPAFKSSIAKLLDSVDAGGGQLPDPVETGGGDGFSGARILLAEDNVMNMEISRQLMEAAGLEIDAAWNGKEAAELFVSSAPGTYVAVLMDIHMPVMNGHEATRMIRASQHPEAETIPIIALTADAFSENVTEALSAGMNDHISKPIDIQILFGVLRKYIRK